jgi:hypothetical protein
MWFLLPAAAVVGVCVIYFSSTVGIGRFFDCTVVFPFKYWGSSNWNSWSGYVLIGVLQQISQYHFRIWRPLFLAALVPPIYLVSVASYWKRNASCGENEKKTVVLLIVLGTCLFLSVANSASLERLSAVSLPAFILLVWCDPVKGLSRHLQAILWIIVASVMIRDVWVVQRRPLAIFNSPAGLIALTSRQKLEYYEWLAHNTHPSDYVFDADANGAYFRFDLRNPSELPYITSCDITRPEQVTTLVRDLEEHQVRIVIWDGSVNNTGRPAETDHLSPLREYFRAKYREVA